MRRLGTVNVAAVVGPLGLDYCLSQLAWFHGLLSIRLEKGTVGVRIRSGDTEAAPTDKQYSYLVERCVSNAFRSGRMLCRNLLGSNCARIWLAPFSGFTSPWEDLLFSTLCQI